jgi:hypothetical protein
VADGVDDVAGARLHGVSEHLTVGELLQRARACEQDLRVLVRVLVQVDGAVDQGRPGRGTIGLELRQVGLRLLDAGVC